MMSDGQEPPQKQMKMASSAWDFLNDYIVDEKEKQSVKDLLNEIKVTEIVDLNLMETSLWCKIFAAAPKSILFKDFGRIHKLLEERCAQHPAADILNDRALNEAAARLWSHKVNTNVQVFDRAFLPHQSRAPILVLGSSGSGKTTFVARGLKGLLEQSLLQGEKLFTVYLDASSVRDQENKSKASTLVTKVKDILESKAKVFIFEGHPITGILMVVIIDEVDLQCDFDWAGTRSSLDELITVLRNQVSADDVQLVLAGTGLDAITSSLNSKRECIKIRMKPWKFEEVRWWADNCAKFSNDKEKERILGIISSTSVLKALTTNARAVRFLFETLADYGEYVDKNALIAHAVTSVAFKYITSNCLIDLTRHERLRVAKLALKTLSGAEHGQALQPDCFFAAADHASRNIRRAFFALVETHVENQTLMADQKFAVSVSPAVSIVLAALMGCISTLSSSWSEFETIAALSELQRCIIACEKGDCMPCLLRSRAPFPPSMFQNKLKVPRLDNCTTVVINGPIAPYADVIGHRRLLQCKHRGIPGAEQIDLKEELTKLGVLKPQNYENGDKSLPSRFLTSRLMEQWKQLDRGLPAHPKCQQLQHTDQASGNETASLLQDGCTRSMYPMGQLQFNQAPPDDIDWVEYTLDGEHATHAGSTCTWDPNASFDQEITVVFCTNQSGFSFSSIHERAPFTVSRQHVDNNGERKAESRQDSMNTAIIEYMKELVDEKVKIRFQFCSH